MAPLILVRSDHRDGARAARTLRRLAGRFLAGLRLSDAQLSVVVTTDRRIRAVNRRWRGKDQATDVLSFPAAEVPGPEEWGRPLGDVVISLDTARRRAREDGRRLEDELARYLAHGLLHLLGHDHQDGRQARRMARAEARLLGSAGMVMGPSE